jgi:DNA-directed RNA polymerase subunit omega
MIYPSIDKILQIVGSKYILIQVASERSKEMNATGHLQMKENEYVSKRGIGRAMEEIEKGLIKIEKID